MPTALRLATVAVAVLLLLVACTTEEQAASPESGDFSGPDVAFLQGMIPHHEDGVAMAALVEERSERDELRALARDIVDRQREQAQEMRTLLERAGAQQPDEDAGEGEHDELGEALTEDERTELRNLDGTPFDLTFLRLAVVAVHHGDEVDRDLLRARLLALAVVRAGAEELLHRVDHVSVRAKRSAWPWGAGSGAAASPR
jgi:uncharacterized protein (DUF305 family)